MPFTPCPVPTFQRWQRRSLMLLAAAALAACGGGGQGTTEPPPASAPAVRTAQTGEVLGYVKQRLQARGPRGTAQDVQLDATVWMGTVATASGTTVSASGTVVQEAGVDEADLVKTAGRRVYALQPLAFSTRSDRRFAQLSIHDLAADGHPQAAGGATLKADDDVAVVPQGLLVAPDAPRLAMVADATAGIMAWPECPPGMACTLGMPWQPVQPKVHVQLMDASTPDTMPAPQRLQFDGRLVGTRQVGRMLYVVALHTPQLAFDLLPVVSSAADRQAALDKLTIADVLPRISVDGGAPQPMVSETDCWLQPANGSNQVAVTTITAIDLQSPGWARSTRCFVGGSEAIYMAPGSLYVATPGHDLQTLGLIAETRTNIHKFSFNGASVAYRGSGFVLGHLGWDAAKKPYRMSEHNGDLRVLSFTGTSGWSTLADAAATKASPATLTVLRERASDASLVTLSTLPNTQRPAPIGKAGEQVYAVRFVADRAYVVTFRQTDPLYVLDLSTPADPRVAGELEVPGYADWLFPLDNGLLFGVGKDASSDGRVQGVRMALFDVRDAARPTLLDARSFGARGSISGLDTSAHGMSLKVAGSTTRLALPLLSMPDVSVIDATDPRAFMPQLSVQRIEVDTAQRRWTFKPAIELGSAWVDLSATRVLQVDDHLYRWADGTLQHWAW